MVLGCSTKSRQESPPVKAGRNGAGRDFGKQSANERWRIAGTNNKVFQKMRSIFCAWRHHGRKPVGNPFFLSNDQVGIKDAFGGLVSAERFQELIVKMRQAEGMLLEKSVVPA